MINQRAYPDIILGTGGRNDTVANYGCYMTSLLHGLQQREYKFTVRDFNNILKQNKTFIQRILLSSTRIASTLDFISEGRNEPWSDSRLIEYTRKKDEYIILGEVSGRAIGGSGQHFVYIDRIDVKSGKITMVYIDDPWDGLENQKVTTRYNRYGNILSFRVFRIKKGNAMSEMFKMKSGNEIDLDNKESMKIAVQVFDDVVNRNLYIKKEDVNKRIETEVESITKELSTDVEKLRKQLKERPTITVEKTVEVPVEVIKEVPVIKEVIKEVEVLKVKTEYVEVPTPLSKIGANQLITHTLAAILEGRW